MMDNFKADLRHLFEGDVTFRRIVYASFEAGVWAVAVFRFGKQVQRIKWALFRKPLLLVYFFFYKLVEVLGGIRISSESEIGPGFVVHNFGGVIVKGHIGKNCVVMQGAQLIGRADGKARGWPTLGDNVMIGAGAKVLGNVHLGNNVKVGANAVVMSDIPDNSVVMPPESKVIKGFYRKAKQATAE